MPRAGATPRGYQLARDYPTVVPPTPQAFSVTELVYRGLPPGDDRILRPAAADAPTDAGAAPDQGYVVTQASASQIVRVNLIFTDAATGTITFQWRKNGATVGSWVYPAGTTGVQAGAVTITNALTVFDTWSVAMVLQNPGVGASLHVVLSVALYP